MKSNHPIDMKLAAAIVATASGSRVRDDGLLFAVNTLWEPFFAKTEREARAFVAREKLTLVEPLEMLAAQNRARASDEREPMLATPSAATQKNVRLWQRIARLQIPFERASRTKVGKDWWHGLCVYRADEGAFLEQFLERLSTLRREYLRQGPTASIECDWWAQLSDIVEESRILDVELALSELWERVIGDES